MYPRISSGEGNPPFPVLGRLVDKGNVQGISTGANFASGTDGTESRIQVESGEVRTGAETSDNILGIQILPQAGYSSPHRRKMGEGGKSASSLYEQFSSSGQDVAIVDWPSGFVRETGTSGASTSQTYSEGIHRSLVSHLPEPGGNDRDYSGSEDRVRLVERQRQVFKRSTYEKPRSTAGDLHGCLGSRLGRSPRGFGGSRHLGRSRSEPPYQCEGDAERTVCPFSFQGYVERKDNNGGNRQYYGNALHPKAGRHKIKEPMACDSDVVPVSGTVPYPVEVQAHSREVEREGGQAVKDGSSAPHGVESASLDFREDLDQVGETSHRSLCNKRQSAASNVRISFSGQGSLGGGCFEYKLGPDLRLCVSADCHPSQSSTKDQGIELRDCTDSSSLDKAILVCNDSRAAGGLASSSSDMAENVKTAQVQHISQSSRDIQPTCVEIIQRSHEDQGFSAEAASRMAKSQKDSTIAVYQGKWNNFNEWCKSKNISSTHAQVTDVADFLCYLRTEKDLAASTIEGYRTAIGHVVKAVTGREIGKDARLTSLINNLARTGQVKKSLVPSWDLSLVLLTLTKSPFEPMHLADMKYVTLKTVFLLALASGRRRGEIHALQADIQHSEHWRDITIFTDSTFISKTQLRVRGAEPMKPLVLDALTKSLGPEMQEDRSLCVVRAVKFYLSRTREVRQGRKRLFLAYKKGHTSDICKNTISSWIRKTVILAYEKSGKEDQQVAGVRAHDVRGMASSWALLKNASIEDILQACSWRSHSTFTRFYLKDLTRIQGDLLRLGPVNTALHTV